MLDRIVDCCSNRTVLVLADVETVCRSRGMGDRSGDRLLSNPQTCG